jgi:hypothetical protein
LPKLLLILALAVGMSACAHTANDSGATDGNTDSSAATADEPKKRCYREKETGSRLGRRVCVTVDE